jgi:hypothetical protein
MMPIRLCKCGATTGNPDYASTDPMTQYVVKRFFMAAVLGKNPSPPPSLTEPYTCDRCTGDEQRQHQHDLVAETGVAICATVRGTIAMGVLPGGADLTPDQADVLARWLQTEAMRARDILLEQQIKEPR